MVTSSPTLIPEILLNASEIIISGPLPTASFHSFLQPATAKINIIESVLRM